MGEHSIIEIAEALDAGIHVRDITFIAGTVYKTRMLDEAVDTIVLPSYEKLKEDKLWYARSFYTQYCNTDAFAGKRLLKEPGIRPTMPGAAFRQSRKSNSAWSATAAVLADAVSVH